MEFPSYTIERINTYGIHFDPNTFEIPSAYANEACAPYYELRFFLRDWEGGPVIDGIHYPSRKGYFTCCKPMQSRRYSGPFSFYLFCISTRDPHLCTALNSLPACAFHPEMDRILELFLKMAHVDTRNTLDARLEIYSYANSLLRLLFKPQYEPAHTIEGNPRRHQEALLAARKYLQEHLQEDIKLEELARESNLHPTYFHKLFTAAFGRTPAQQLMWYRIMASREHLRDDNCSITEIAMKCGFSSQSYFCRKFKELSSSTPSQYRRTIRTRRR